MVVSVALAGAAVGSLCSGTVSDYYGRRHVIMFADVAFTIGSLLMGFADTIQMLMIGRVIVGIGVGVAAQIVPLYLAEVSPQEIRGMLISFNVAMITIGQLLSVIFVYFVKPNWRAMLGCAAIPSILQFIGMMYLPESPRWLGKMERPHETK